MPPPIPPRRRREARFALRAPLRVKCDSWANAQSLVLSNLSHSGMFINTPEPAALGEMVAIALTLPDGQVMQLKAIVRHLAEGRGIGVEIIEGDQRYRELVRRVQQAVAARPSDADEVPLIDEDPGEEEDEDDLVPIFFEEASAEASTSAAGEVGPRQADPAAWEQARQALTWTLPRPPVVAIDFGTSRSSVAIVIGNEAKVLKLDGGDWQIPSAVGFTDKGVIVGVSALELLERDPTRVITSPKRLLGRRYDDPEIAPHLAALPISASRDRGGEVALHPAGQTYSMTQVCAPILRHLKQVAEAQLGVAVERAVLTVPVSHDERRCEALKRTARLAGLEVVEFIEEPTAAVVAQCLDVDCRGLVAVYDFGGGTFDFSVVDVRAADFQVVATAGDTWLGGDDLDDALAGAVANAFWQTRKIELRKKLVEWQRLLRACERSKRELSLSQKAMLQVGNLALTSEGSLGLEVELGRPQFARLAATVIDRSIATCSDALELSGLTPSDLSAVYMSGGTSYVPAVRAAVARYFGRTPRAFVAPERAVVIGAALYSNELMNSRAAAPPASMTPPAPISLPEPEPSTVPEVMGLDQMTRGERRPAPGRERRDGDRRSLVAELTFFGQHNFYLGYSQNISRGGVFVATSELMEVGEELEVRFTLPGTVQPCVALCTVQWTREPNPSAPEIPPGIGCKFTRISAEALSMIDAFIQHRDPLFHDD